MLEKAVQGVKGRVYSRRVVAGGGGVCGCPADWLQRPPAEIKVLACSLMINLCGSILF